MYPQSLRFGYFELPSVSYSFFTPAPLLPGVGATNFPTALDSVGLRDRASVGCPPHPRLAAAGLPAGANATAQASTALTCGAEWVWARCDDLPTQLPLWRRTRSRSGQGAAASIWSSGSWAESLRAACPALNRSHVLPLLPTSVH